MNIKSNIHKVAELANVSTSTVSRVINNQPSVSEKTRQKVNNVIAELNYQPSKLARGFSSDGYDAILIIYTRSSKLIIDNPYFSAMINAISVISEQNNYDIILQSSDEEEKEISKTLSLINDRLIKGIILLSSRTNDKLIAELSKTQIPIVVIGKVVDHIKTDIIVSVNTDNFNDSKAVGDYLITIGHRDIACVHAPKEYHVSIERINGFLQAFKDNNIHVSPDSLIDGGYTVDSAFEATLNLLCRKKVTAVFATDDTKALGVYKAAKSLSLTIPDDLSVIGHNDYEFSKMLTPSLSTVRVPIYELGFIASTKLFSMIKNNIKETDVILPTELLIRSSANSKADEKNH